MAQDQSELYLLLDRICEGHQGALATFYDLTISRVFGVVMKVTANHELAEEIVSDVYLQVWRSADRYNADKASPLAWLTMMTRSRAIDAIRRESSATRNQVAMPEDCEFENTAVPEPLQATLGVERNSELANALKLLDKKQHNLIALAFYKGMSHQEISDFTDLPLGTVKTTLRRAQAILRAALSKVDWPEKRYYEQA